MAENNVKMQYDAVSTICDKLEIIKNDLNDQWEEINNILSDKETIWQGEAANRFFNGLYKVNSKAIETTDVKGLPAYIERVRELIDLNREIDRKLMDISITEVNNNAPVIQSNRVTIEVNGVNNSLNEKVKANNNIKSNESIVDAKGINKELNNSVKVDDNIKESTSTVEANGIDTDLINRVSINNNIH